MGLFVGKRQFQTFRKGTKLLRLNKNCTHVSGEAMVLPIFPRKAEVPRVPESFHVGASGAPTACHEDFGADAVSKNCSHLRDNRCSLPFVASSNQQRREPSSSSSHRVTYASTINQLPFKTSFLERVADWNHERFPSTNPFHHKEHAVAKMYNCQQEDTQKSSRACVTCRNLTSH